MRTGNTNRRPGPVNINLGDKVDIFKLRRWTSNKNCRLGPVNTNIRTKAGKVNLGSGGQGQGRGRSKGPETGKYKDPD